MLSKFDKITKEYRSIKEQVQEKVKFCKEDVGRIFKDIRHDTYYFISFVDNDLVHANYIYIDREGYVSPGSTISTEFFKNVTIIEDKSLSDIIIEKGAEGGKRESDNERVHGGSAIGVCGV